jgi:hypothetical protein
MARFIVVAALVALASTSALAQTPPPDFVTVDAVSVSNLTLHITGIVEGGQTADRRSLDFTHALGQLSDAIKIEALRSCKEFAFVAMSKPGQYRLRAWDGYPPVCGLVRVNP